MQGVIGETYARLLAGPSANVPGHPLFQENDGLLHGSVSDYSTLVFPEAARTRSLDLKDAAGSSMSRRQLAGTAIAFPLSAGGRLLQVAQAASSKPVRGHRRMLR